ncbi:MAG TPA: thiamine pyrophosphate-binding protein [Planctomycetaceae bacterium]|nr:thiamine pyrophosphate-binding protein [Planctomycetaceae bacterium]
MKLSDYIFQFVAELGIKHVFMLSGGGAMHLDDSLGRCKPIEYVCNLHEQACAIAAEAYAKVTDDLGVALVTTGPGGTNSITGVAGAWLDSTPCLFISGQVKRPDLKGTSGLRQLGVQEVDIVSLVSPITKYAVTVTDPTSIRYHLEKAVHLAKTGRPGPVWIDVPLDVQAAPIDETKLTGFEPDAGVPLFDESRMREQVAQVVELLNQSERPLLLAGSGIRLARAGSDFLALVDRLAIPAEAATSLGIDLIPGNHPLFFGRPGPIAPRYANFILQNCDLLITVGARLDMAMTAYAHERLARGAKKVMVDIDPAEIAKMKTTIHVPVQADAGAFLRELLQRTEPNRELRPRDRSAWIARCRQWRERYPVVLPEHRELGGMVSTYYLTEVLCQEMDGDDVIASGSSGNAVELFHLCFQHKAGQRVIHTRGLGAMGFGIPAAIGACLGAGRRRTICLDGDGGFHLNIQELETVARLKLPIKFFVINNNGYASIRISQAGYFQGRLCGADPTSGVTLPDLLKISEAYGIRAVRLADQNDLRARVSALLNEPGPLVVDVMVPPDEVRAPRVISVPRPDGSMVSKPLEDLWPFLPRDEFLSNMIVPAISE